MGSKDRNVTLARWSREVGLVALGSLVFPALITRLSLPAVVAGLAVACLAYAVAVWFLFRS